MSNRAAKALPRCLGIRDLRGGMRGPRSARAAAIAEVVRYFDAVPVIVNVRSPAHNIDPAAIDRALTPKTRAIIPVHFAGSPCDMDEIASIARPRGISVIDDAAHAFPVSYRRRKVGTLAGISCFTFYATKTITTGEGGAAVTSNPNWAARMRIMAMQGISRDAWNRYAASGTWYYEVVAPGYKYNQGAGNRDLRAFHPAAYASVLPDQFGYGPESLPAACDVYFRSILLPVYSKMTDMEVERVVSVVLDVVAGGRA